MAAISKAWVSIADAAVDPDSPVDTSLMEGIRDDLVHLREWVGASFFAGAVQDHNHDGANSALIEIGPNLLRNGSFEDDEAGWTITDYSGGSHAISTSTRHHGEKSLAITSTVTANGGGDALSGQFIPVAEGRTYRVDALLSASGANVSSRLQVVWYDAGKSQVSAANVLDLTNTPTSATHYSSPMTAPATARFAKIKAIGGVPGAGSSAGTIFFDALIVADPPSGLAKLMAGSVANAATLDIVMTQYAGYRNKLLVLTSFRPATGGSSFNARCSADGGSTFDSGAGNYQYARKIHSSSPSSSDGGGTDTVIGLAVNVSGTAAESTNAKLWMFDTNTAAQNPKFGVESESRDSTPNTVVLRGSVTRVNAQVTNAMRILFSSGNISIGEWTLYGLI